MTRGLYTAYTGMVAQQLRLDTISNNLANVNTNGYKKDNVVFQSFNEAYMMKINDPEQAGVNQIGKTTSGTKIGSIYTDFEQGTFQETNNPYNVALQGTGMIAVGKLDAEGNMTTKYTRDGSFILDSSQRLVTTDGYFVLGDNGPITISGTNVRINENGEIYTNNTYTNKLQIVDFEDLGTLKKIGGCIYEATDSSEQKAFSGTVLQGFVEGSNVNSVDEMVNMINVMRNYETNQKVISTYDDTLNKVINEITKL